MAKGSMTLEATRHLFTLAEGMPSVQQRKVAELLCTAMDLGVTITKEKVDQAVSIMQEASRE